MTTVLLANATVASASTPSSTSVCHFTRTWARTGLLMVQKEDVSPNVHKASVLL